MARKFNQNVIFSEVSDIVMAAKKMPDDDPAVLQSIESIKNEVAEVTIGDDWIMKAAKLENVFTGFWTKNKLSAMSVQCWPSMIYLWGVSVCALFGRLTGKNMLTACETDTMGALAMLINYRAALGETLPHFVDWTIQHREDSNKLLAWHCGNAPVCLAKDPSKTALRSRMDMKGEGEAKEGDMFAGLYQFQVKSGDVTFCRLAELDGEWKMLIAPGKAVPSDDVLAGTWSWVEVSDHEKLYRTLVEEGFIHHASMIHGDQTEVLSLVCKLMDIKPVVVR
jgi:L-fucose isomerase-like protein